jgi:cell division protein FtsB
MMTAMKKGSKTAGAARPRGRSRSVRAAARSLGRPSLAMVLLFAGLILASAFVAIEIQRNALARDAAAYGAELAAAASYNKQLTADVAAKKTDDYVVNKARDYGYVLPGEAIIGVQHEVTPAAVIASAPSASRAQKWLALFFGAR